MIDIKILIRRWFFIPRLTFQIHYDFEYGIDKRTGWSVFMDGCCLSEFEKWLIMAIIRAWWKRAYLWDNESI